NTFKSLGGEHVKFKLKGGNRVNPFDLARVSNAEIEKNDELGNVFFDKLIRLTTMFKLMYPVMNDLQEDILTKMLSETYRKKGITEDTDTSELTDEDFPIMEDLYKTIGENIEK